MAHRPRPITGYTATDFRRRFRQREPYDRLLIVCEGLTEKHYFEGLVFFLGLSSANIRVSPSRKTDPVDVVRYGIDLAKEAHKTGDAYQRLYCVFDLDRPHQNAFDLAAATRMRSTSLHLATSNPCFEIWLRLHFGFTDRGFTAVGARTACDAVEDELLTHEPRYRRGQEGLFGLFAQRVDDAVTNSRRLEASNRDTGSSNPSCTVHELARDLFTLKAN
jgi:hypothetical protein